MGYRAVAGQYRLTTGRSAETGAVADDASSGSRRTLLPRRIGIFEVHLLADGGCCAVHDAALWLAAYQTRRRRMAKDGNDHFSGKMGVNTRLAHSGNNPHDYFGFVNPPVVHASTVLYRDAAS